MKIIVAIEFEDIKEPDSEEATAKVQEVMESCKTMQVAFDANSCWVDDCVVSFGDW
jgi:hypothetical protein